jgi:hypothetical protein
MTFLLQLYDGIGVFLVIGPIKEVVRYADYVEFLTIGHSFIDLKRDRFDR